VKQFNAVARWHSDRVDTYTWKPVPRQLTEDDKAPRERVLTRGEIAELWRASEGDLYGQLLRFVLLTAMRSAEARLLHRRELAPDLSMVTLPPERCKTKITLRLPLSGMAQDIIRPLLRDDSPWVFSFDGFAPISDSGRYMAEFRAKLAPVQQPWTIHDLRRTSATLMEEAGVPPHVIDLGVLHQKRRGISRTYMLHNYTAEKKEAVEALARIITSIIT
jgi:integrase